jgi:predicted NBD/HSP70 family sugar kinase
VIQHEPLSRADLVRLTHISKPTVSNLVDELLQRNLVLEIGQRHGRAGRKPMLLKFDSMRKCFLAFDIGREDYQIAISDLKGHILDKQRGEFEQSQTSREKLTTLRTAGLKLIDRVQIPLDRLLKIHGCAPGVCVGYGKGMQWFSGSDMPEDYDMQMFFEEAFQTPVLLNHSSKMSLFGENIAGKAQKVSHAVYIDFGYGLGCAFMFNNRIYFGAKDSAGEIGYMYSDLKEFNSHTIVPYEWGILETIISGRALQQKGINLVDKQKDTKMLELVGGDARKITAKIIFNAAKQGDPHAYFILKESFRYFNMTLCNIINMLNPELVILGGGISKAGDFLLDFIVNEIQDKVLFMPEFAISELQDDATVIGAIAYLIEHTDFLTEL